MTANPNRYTGNYQKRAAYENACDCLYWGMGSKYWERMGLCQSEAEEVWSTAFYDMGDGADEWLK